MTEKYISSERGKTYYWIGKTKSPFTLVFLHGLTANHHLFDRQTEFFSKKYSVIVWDAPAHGKSRPYKDFSYPNAAEELKSILDIEEIDHIVLIGQSAGGFVAQSFYKKYPDIVDGIITIGTCPYGPSYYSKSDIFWLRQTKWMFDPFPDKLLRKTMAMMCGYTKRARKNMLSMLKIYPKDELCRLMYIGFAGFIPEIGEMNIRCPMWLTVGEYDKTGKVMSYNNKCHKNEGFPLYIIKNASHNANDDQPEKFNRLLESFLRKL